MFPFQRSCDFSFQISGNNIEEEEEDQMMVDAATTSNPTIVAVDYKRKRIVEGHGGVEETKKMQHRENEKQRRVVMAGFLSTLRSLLPLEFVKGTRSVSDHLAETTNFIKHLQNNIKELQAKRDILKASLQEQASSAINNNNIIIPSNVAVTITSIGLDVQISTGNARPRYRLSDPFLVLLDHGVGVVCSVSSKVDDIFHHKIQCQVDDPSTIDIQRLEQRLYDVVSSNSSSSSM